MRRHASSRFRAVRLNPMFRAASVFVPEFVVLRWLRRSITFFLGFARWLKFRSGLGMLSLFQKQRSGWGTFSLFLWGSISLFLGIPKQRFEIFEAALLEWLGRKTCWGSAFSDAVPTQLSWALPGGCSFAVAGARFHCFRGSKSNVSRFLRLQFRNGSDAKPAGALPFRMRSRRSFLRLCLVAEVSRCVDMLRAASAPCGWIRCFVRLVFLYLSLLFCAGCEGQSPFS